MAAVVGTVTVKTKAIVIVITRILLSCAIGRAVSHKWKGEITKIKKELGKLKLH